MICVLYIWGGSLRGLSAGLKNQTVWVRLPPAPPVEPRLMLAMRDNKADSIVTGPSVRKCVPQRGCKLGE